ncbi:hypothetical protein GQ44DRAFT_702299 [Phaeosphaeriaceae sp. PMI808]|nr:hypothetical protein GQ44DRAFT_702299 [Phaeosphaeriaceae sp. PMI808]
MFSRGVLTDHRVRAARKAFDDDESLRRTGEDMNIVMNGHGVPVGYFLTGCTELHPLPVQL